MSHRNVNGEDSDDGSSTHDDREWRLLRNICKRVFFSNGSILQSLGRWFCKEADQSEKKIFGIVLNGLLHARRGPSVQSDHPSYGAALEDVRDFGKGILNEQFHSAAISWLCRNPDLREAFIAVCASYNNCQKPYLSNYGSSFTTAVGQPPIPFQRYKAPTSVGVFIHDQPISISTFMKRDTAIEGVPNAHKGTSIPVIQHHSRKDNSRGRAGDGDSPSSGPFNNARLVKTIPSTAINPSKSMKARKRPWPTFDFSISSFKSEHQASFGQPHGIGNGRQNMGREEMLSIAHVPTGPAGPCSAYYVPNTKFIEKQRSDIYKDPTQSISISFQKLPSLKVPLPSPKPLIPSTRHGHNPHCKTFTQLHYPWDSQGEEYLRDIMQSTYHADIDRSAERLYEIRNSHSRSQSQPSPRPHHHH